LQFKLLQHMTHTTVCCW